MLMRDAIAAADLDTYDLVVAKVRRHARGCTECAADFEAAAVILQRIQARHPQRIGVDGGSD